MIRCLVAVSGGMDSLACACLLREEGHDIVPVHFLTGYESEPVGEKLKAIEKILGLSVHLVDFSEHFRTLVIRPFIREYASGRTPNPCLVCNPAIKFGVLLDLLGNFHCNFLATGHYAKILPLENGKKGLFKGKDQTKDQSYFLAGIPEKRLERILFPLGSWTKQELRQKILAEKLFPLTEKESQDICFLHGGNYGNFLEQEGNIRSIPGPIVTRDGKIIGAHKGLHRYTIGQRRGLDCPGPAPYYVLQLDFTENRLVAGFREELLSGGCEVHHINWLIPLPKNPFRAGVKIRYRHQEVETTICPEGKTRARILFSEPQQAVTPGQGAVFYEGNRVLGGGVIQKSLS